MIWQPGKAANGMGVSESLALLAPIALLCAQAADSPCGREERDSLHRNVISAAEGKKFLAFQTV